MPCPTRHRIDVSDSHVDPSHAVLPTRTVPLCAPLPTPDPCNVTLLDPDDARLLRLAELTIPDTTETPSDMLPPLPPTVITVRRLPPGAPLPIHRTLVSDCHLDTSQELLPILAASLPALSPNPDPCTVTLVPPVPARFVVLGTLTLAVSTLTAPVTLPTRRPVVTDICLLLANPCAHWQRSDVSDSHVVRSQPVCPILTDPLNAAQPIPAPCKVMLLPPVAPVFVRSVTLPELKSVV